VNRPDLCLEFVNTRYWRGQETPTETLNSAEDLSAWAAGNISKEARPLAKREFERAIEARETIHRVFDATARGKTPAGADLETLNGLLAASPARTTLRRERNGFSWDVDMRGGTALGQRGQLILFDRVIAALQRRLDAESDTDLARGMRYPTRWDPFFQDYMTLADLYRFPTQHFDFHRRQLTLAAGTVA